MNDTIQILIFIATIVIFVISALRKQKSKQQAEPSEFQEAIEELFGIPSTPNKAKVNVENQKDDKINTSAKRPFVQVKQKVTLEGEKAIIVNQVPQMESEITHEEKTLEFDLKQAIIYSTIMEPKYF